MFSGKEKSGGGSEKSSEKKKSSGGNVQRENFGKKSSGGGESKPEPEPKAEGGSTTTITHNADGSHSAKHSDGESSDHPSMGHLAMHLHSKHSDGEAMHVHKHDGGVSTHHVGMDGMVEGPHDHADMGAASDHMQQVLGQDGMNGSMAIAGGSAPDGGMGGKMAGHAMPSLY